MRRIVTICVCTLLAAGISWAADAEPSVEDLRSQAELYAKRGHLKQARRALAKAYSKPGGAEDYGVVFQRARLAEKMNFLAEAFRFSSEAIKVASTRGQRTEAEAQLESLNETFGYVEIYAAAGESQRRGWVKLTSSTRHINPIKKRQFANVVKGLENNGIEVPSRIYLPYGDYVANNVAFSIVNGEPAPNIEIFLEKSSREESGGENLWWYVGIGSLTAIAAGVAALVLTREEGASREVEVRVRISSLTGQ